MPQSSKPNYWKITLASAQKAFEQNGFAVSVHASLDEAKNALFEKISSDCCISSVGVGGSKTVTDSGIKSDFESLSGITVIDPWAAPTREEAMELCRKALLVDYYISSSNAVTKDGKLVNLDMIGNRVGAMIFGPRKVALLVGRNKICETVEAAMEHIRTKTAPMNTIRLGSKTPCTKTGTCMQCKSPERICNFWTITEKCYPEGRIHIYLVDADEGF